MSRRRNKKYSKELKSDAVQAYLKGEGSLRRLARHRSPQTKSEHENTWNTEFPSLYIYTLNIKYIHTVFFEKENQYNRIFRVPSVADLGVMGHMNENRQKKHPMREFFLTPDVFH